MPDLPVSSEMVEFAVNVAQATNRDKLEWEVTADEDVLLASLGGPYTAKLERVLRSRGDVDDDVFTAYELVLIKGRDELFRLDADMLSETSFAKSIGKQTYSVLREMWTRAILKAKKVTEELNEVNRLLSAKLGSERSDGPDDDDEVPF